MLLAYQSVSAEPSYRGKNHSTKKVVSNNTIELKHYEQTCDFYISPTVQKRLRLFTTNFYDCLINSDVICTINSLPLINKLCVIPSRNSFSTMPKEKQMWIYKIKTLCKIILFYSRREFTVLK